MKDVRAQLALLVSLQDIDVQIHRINRELGNIPKERENLGAPYLTIKRDLDAAQIVKEKSEAEKTNFEKEIKEFEGLAKERESKMYSIKTNKEYQAVLREIAQAKMSNKERTNKVKVLFSQIEELTQNISQLSQALADKESEYKNIDQNLKEREKNLLSEREGFESKRPEIETKVDKELMRKYMTVKGRYPDPMARAEKNICRGCHMNIPPQLFNNVLKFDQFYSCPRCFRIFYYKEEVQENDEEQAKE
ncbi:hypothetical protein KKA47_07435 [bacterium]|nr:hypothetical protein [bacterium]